MSDAQPVKTAFEDGILTIAFDRPEALNAMSQAMGNRMREVVRDAARNPDVRVVVLTGEGRAFCAGGDLKNLGKPDPADPVAVQFGADPRWNDIELKVDRLVESAETYYALHAMPKPTIAMINGPAVGAGMAPALACDLRVCSDEAYFNTGYANAGLSGDIGTNYFLNAVVGPAKARELLFFSRKILPEEALRIGLVTRVVPHAELRQQTLALARELASGPTIALGHIKENLRAAQEGSPRQAFDIEARNFARCFQTADQREAVAAFKERRKPLFRGN